MPSHELAAVGAPAFAGGDCSAAHRKWAGSIVGRSVTEIAIIPGRMTRNGNSIFGNAAMRGVRRAEFIDSAAMARCTTRKSVHQ